MGQLSITIVHFVRKAPNLAHTSSLSYYEQIWILGHLKIFDGSGKWLPQPSAAEFEMAQYPNLFII